MLNDYYKGIVQHLTKWEISAPKMINELEKIDSESFIDAVNSGELPNNDITQKITLNASTQSQKPPLINSENEEVDQVSNSNMPI